MSHKFFSELDGSTVFQFPRRQRASQGSPTIFSGSLQTNRTQATLRQVAEIHVSHRGYRMNKHITVLLRLLTIFVALHTGQAIAAASIRDALFVNASTSANKTSVIRLLNLNNQSGTLTASAYNEAGTALGTANASLGNIAAGQMLTLSSGQLEAAIGYAAAAPTAKYRIVFKSDLPGFELINFVKDIATGNLSYGQAQTDHRAATAATSSTRNALFVNASSSGNKTSVIRLINLLDQAGTLTATAYNEAGTIVGTPNAALGAFGAQQMLVFTSAQLEAAIGYAPSSATAKYRIAFSANLPNFELINFIKDMASGNLTLGQAQTDNRAGSSATSSVRNALYVNPSSAITKTSVVRIINLGNQGAALIATAYNESGAVVGTADAALGNLAAQQMLSFTSAQLEAAIGYAPTSAYAKYRIAFSAGLPSFELINFIKETASGSLTLAQDQIDDRVIGAGTSTRNALFVNASTSPSKTSVLRIVNNNGQSGILTATAYNESGAIVGAAGATLGTIGAQQMLNFTSAQLEAAIGYTPTVGTAKYHIVLSANLPGFEVLAFNKDTTVVTLTATPTGATSPATITLTASANDSDGSLTRLEFFSGSNSLATLTALPYRFDWSNVAAGSYSITARATDSLGTITISAAAAVVVTEITGPLNNVRKDAARFMRQATFGASREAIDALVTQGYAAWLDDQFAKPLVSHVATVQADPNLPASPWAVTMPSIWKQFFEGDDQLRQRVSFALSQILVVSLNNNVVQDAPCGAAKYLDILNTNAFGNARTLLKDVTLNPVMGEYLSMKESAKGDPLLQTQPDENYARELMQLFSVGTVMLNNDGSVKLDAGGKPIPTYTEDTVKDFAKALSGWTFAGQNQTLTWRWLYPDIWDADATIRTQKGCAAWTSPMEPWTAKYRSSDDTRDIAGPAHDTGSKQLLQYAGAPFGSLPANQPPQTDLDNVIDNIFNHPNVGPFLGKQLIQRLVTSNPSSQYVERVALVFNNNGSGVRGDMKAVVRAILLDNEARSLSVASMPSFGKLSEPVIRFVQLHRAFNARRAGGYYDLWDFSAATALNQNPLRAPSVFNFFHPNFTPAGPLAQRGLVGPEFEITNASSVAGLSDFSKWGIIGGFDHGSSIAANRILPNYSYYLGLSNSPSQMLDELDLVLCAGGMNPLFKAQIVQAVGKVSASQSQERLNMALWLIINSPDYSVQK
jgi:uncharacterized protein (DUF1800 family)